MHKVPKNIRFLVSNGFSGWLHSGVLYNNNVSPVKLELSTFIPLLSITLISAGILLPNSTITISPGTKFSAGIFVYFPFLITYVSGGIKFLNASIKAADF